MDVNKVLRELIFRYNSFPAVKLAWECQLPIPTSQLPMMTPSHYMKETTMTTEGRMDLLCKQHKDLEFWDPGTDFIVTPSIIVFQNFQPTQTYCLTIHIRNISKRIQKVAILMENSSEFSVDDRSVKISKFAPGMSFKSNIYFTPQYDRDYFHKLVVVTKDSRFAIPILGIGSRGILNPPDLIDFNEVPVKHLKTRVISMTNIGNRPARFLLTANGPFCVSPERGVVDAKQCFTMEVSFYSDKTATAEGYLTIQYDNGEEVTVTLRGKAVNARIYLEKPRIVINDTYMGLKGMSQIRIINDSPIVAEFKWKKYSKSKASLGEFIFGEIEEKKAEHLNYTNHYSINRGDSIHSQFLAEPSVICMDDDDDPFDSGVEGDPTFVPGEFLIEPVWGKVQPYSSTQCLVLFSPYHALYFEKVAYLDITGHEERLQLILCANCVKPKFTFGFDENFVPLPLVSGHKNAVGIQVTALQSAD